MQNKINIWEHIKKYKFKSLFVRNFLLIVLFIPIPLLSINIVALNYCKEITKAEISKANTDDVYKVRDMIDIMFIEVDRLSVRIAAEPIIEEFSKFARPERMDMQTIKLIQDVQKLLMVITVKPSYVDSILVYSDANGYALNSNKEVGTNWQGFNNAWRASYETKRHSKNQWYSSITYSTSSENYRYLSSFRMMPLHEMEKLGVIIINVDVEELSDYLKSQVADRRIMIVDKEGEILYGGETANRYSEIVAWVKDMPDFNEHTFIDQESGGEVVSMVRSQHLGWVFVSIMPMNEYYKNIIPLERYIIISIISGVILALLVTLFISTKVFKPIKEIMDKLKEDNISEDMEYIVGQNEYSFIVSSISLSQHENEKMRKELMKRQELLNQSQAIALQSQINPHFLYNTLENINWKVMGLTNGENEGSKMISLLAKLLRLSLQGSSNIATIREEMEHARLYVEIQKIRCDGKFEVIWDIDENILDVRIVRITLQPIIENAINHGIRHLETKGIISIRGRRTNGDIELTVEDNGVGADKDKVEAINGTLESDYIVQDEHVGIRNVNHRIRLAFGPSYGISVSMQEEGGGLNVTIRLPFSKNGGIV